MDTLSYQKQDSFVWAPAVGGTLLPTLSGECGWMNCCKGGRAGQ